MPGVLPWVCAWLLVWPSGAAQSLEELLERARQQQAQLEQASSQKVQALFDRHDATAQPIPKTLRESLAADLAGLGAAAAGRLIQNLDPGLNPDLTARSRAQLCASALTRMELSAHVARLLALLEQSSPAGVAAILEVLSAASPGPDQIARMHAIFDAKWRGAKLESEEEVRATFLARLLALDGGNLEFVDGLLSAKDSGLVQSALLALGQAAVASATPAVRKLLFDPELAPRYAPSLLLYFRSVAAQVSPKDVLALVAVAMQAPTDRKAKLDILESLGEFSQASPADVRRAMERWDVTSDPLLKEAVQVALARAGDRAARRDVLVSYDKDVENNPRQPSAWTRRAELYLRMNDADLAIKDFKEAIGLAKSDYEVKTEVPLGLARAYARKGRFKDVADWLRKVQVSAAKLQEWTSTNEFAEFRKSKYGQELFGVQ